MKNLWLISFFLFLIASCGEKDEMITVEIKSSVSHSADLKADNEDQVDTVTSYQVIFHQIKVGKDDGESEVLWHSITGENKDIANEIEFDQVNELKEDEYDFIELTLGSAIHVEGSKSIDGKLESFQGDLELDQLIYTFGKGNGLAEKVKIEEGKIIFIGFDITNTISIETKEADQSELLIDQPAVSVHFRS